MNRIRIAGLAFLPVCLLLVLPGCIVRSAQPWLENDSIVFEENLLGGWIGKDGDGAEAAMTFLKNTDKPNSYVVQFVGKDGQGTFTGRVGKFGSDYYLEFQPKEGSPGLDGFMLFRTYSAARLDFTSEQLVVWPLNYEAVKAAAKLDRLRGVKFVWDDENELLLVSKTEELQRFLLSLGRESDLFAKPMRLTRKK